METPAAIYVCVMSIDSYSRANATMFHLTEKNIAVTFVILETRSRQAELSRIANKKILTIFARISFVPLLVEQQCGL